MVFKKGHKPWNTGKKMPEHCGFQKGHECYLKYHTIKSKQKISETHKGRIKTEEHKRKISETQKRKWEDGGYKLNPTCFQKGHKHSKETLIKISKALTGENNPGWQGGYSYIYHRIRHLGEYHEWRIKVFKKDNWKCQECGKRGEEPHHLIPLSTIVKKNDIRDIDNALNCKELWDINNGQTLCIPCHRKLDKYRR